MLRVRLGGVSQEPISSRDAQMDAQRLADDAYLLSQRKAEAFDEIAKVLRYHSPASAKPLSVYGTTVIKGIVRKVG